MDLVDMDYADGTNPIPGLATYMYIAKRNDILTLEEPAASPTTPAQIVTITDDHVMKTGKKAIKVYIVRDKGELNAEGVGGIKMVASKSTVKIMIPGDGANQRGQVTLMQNTDLIAWVPDRKGVVTQLGDKNLSCILSKWALKGGAKAGDDIGWEMELSFDGVLPYIYEGAIPTTPGA